MNEIEITCDDLRKAGVPYARIARWSDGDVKFIRGGEDGARMDFGPSKDDEGDESGGWDWGVRDGGDGWSKTRDDMIAVIAEHSWPAHTADELGEVLDGLTEGLGGPEQVIESIRTEARRLAGDWFIAGLSVIWQRDLTMRIVLERGGQFAPDTTCWVYWDGKRWCAEVEEPEHEGDDA